jgi:hypothetical protein
MKAPSRRGPRKTGTPAPNHGPGEGPVRSEAYPVCPIPTDAPSVSPLDDVEALEALEEKITTLAAHIHAATHRLLVLVADFDRRQGWKLGGHRSCAHWLSFRTGIDLGTAREKVRTARALVGLPETSASMSRGELSFSKVRAVTRVATAENERKLLKVAQNSTTAQLERKVRSFKRGSREDEAALERRRFESRSLSVFSDHEGMYVVRGRLTAEVGALLMRAVEAASDALYREEGASEADLDSESGRESQRAPGRELDSESEAEARRAAAQRRADALGLLIERALAVGFGADGDEIGGRIETQTDDGALGESDPQPAGGICEGAEECDEVKGGRAKRGQVGGGLSKTITRAPTCGTRAERYQVMLHVEAETLRSDAEVGRSELEDGTRVSAETSQRLSCDAGMVRVHHAPDGSILSVGRRTRTISPSLRRALEVRDGGCRFPGCGSRFTEGHHVTHWAEGGETSLLNCLLLCRHHHRLVHEGGWRVEWRDGEKRTGKPGLGAGSGGGESRDAGSRGFGHRSVGSRRVGSRGAGRHPVFIDPRRGVHSDGGG